MITAFAPGAIGRALAAIQSAEPSLHAFACLRDVESAERTATTLRGPLAGRLIGIKDIFDTADLGTGYGSPIYAHHQPRADAAMVAIIRRAGGLVIGKTVTTEFAYLEPSVTRNPAAAGHTPGGSSSGSAAAVAAGLVDFAIGSQTGGSTVRPASYCGIAGFKPGFGVLPTAGMKCFSWSLDTVGLFARSVRDVALFAEATSGGRIARHDARPASAWTIGVPRAYPWGGLTPSAAQAMQRAVEALQRVGARVVDIDLPEWARHCFVAHDAVQCWEAARALGGEYDTAPEQLSPLLRDYLAIARTVDDAAYAEAQSVAARARAACRSWLPDVDVLLTPSAPDEPPAGFASTGASTFNRAWTLLGTPCVSVPGATGVHGLPMGLQLIAPAGRDADCLEAGELLQGALQRG